MTLQVCGISFGTFKMVRDLTTASAVRRTGGLTQLQYTDAEIGSEISDMSIFLYARYGSPMKRTHFVINDDYLTYDFTGQDNPVFAVDRITLNYSTNIQSNIGSDITNDSNITTDITAGQMTLTSSFVNTHQGRVIYVEWVPQLMEQLCRLKVAKNLIDITGRAAGEETEQSFTSDMMKRIKAIEKELAPRLASLSQHIRKENNQREGLNMVQDQIIKPLG